MVINAINLVQSFKFKGKLTGVYQAKTLAKGRTKWLIRHVLGMRILAAEPR